jgi:hypothetical protein
MCPMCLASLGVYVAASATAGGATALLAARLRANQKRPSTGPTGDDDGKPENRTAR